MEKRHIQFTSDLKTRATDVENEAVIEGYFVRYNEETELWQGYFEEVAPDAFKDSLGSKNILCLDNHDTRIVLGSTDSGTLELRSDEKGLWGSVKIDLEDPNAKSAYRKVQTGKVKGCSFGFIVKSEEHIIRNDNSTLWRIIDAELYEVSITGFPAYPQTDILARKKDAENLKKEALKKRKQKLKERLKNG